jgi:hypothetical protein
MTKESNDIKNAQLGRRLHAPMRFVVAGALQLWLIYYFTHGGALGIGWEFSDALKEFLFVFTPTVSIVFLIPVIIRGSFAQKIMAAILLLPAAWLGCAGWKDVVCHFMDCPFGRN